MELLNKKAVIIGASRGIGRAIALQFAREGAEVTLAGRSIASLEDTVALVREAGAKVHCIEWNVLDCKAAPKKTAQCAEMMGGLDICVCNAGVIDRATPLQVTEEEWDAVIDVNFKGIYFICQAMANYMIANGVCEPKGKIINIASETGFQPSMMPYGASKWGVVGFTMGMARYLFGKGVVLSAIAPGPVTTEMMRWRPGESDAFPSAFGRMASPEEIADLAVFLASKKGDRIAGRPVFINGGLDW